MRILSWTGAVSAAAGICALSACGGGGGHAAAPLPAVTSTPGASGPAVSGTSRITLTIHRAATSTASTARVSNFVPPPVPADVAANPRRMAGRNAMLARFTAHMKTLAAASVRRPKLFSTYAQGLIFTVGAPGTSISQTVYADISTNSPLCTTSNNVSTCTLAVPNIATTESIEAIETDATPNGENTTTGYGTSSGKVSILGAVRQTVSASPGQSIAITMAPVASQILDADGSVSPPYGDKGFYLAANSGGDRWHITLSGGRSSSGLGILVALRDADTDNFLGASGVPLVDVDGTPTPVSITSALSGVTLFTEPDANAVSTTPAYAALAQISDSGSQDLNDYGDYDAVVRLKYDGTPFTTGTITTTNNFTAAPPSYSYGSQAITESWNVTAVSTDVTSANIGVGGTATVTVTDPQSDGADAFDFFYNRDSVCENDDSDETIATVSRGAYDPTSGKQPFTLTGKVAGTCTLDFVDYDSYVEAKTVTITVQ